MSFFAAEVPIVDALKKAIPDVFIAVTNNLETSMRASQIMPAIYVVGLSTEPLQSAIRGRVVQYAQSYAVIICDRIVPDGSGNFKKADSVGTLTTRVLQVVQGLMVSGCATQLQIDGEITPIADDADFLLMPLIFKTTFILENTL